MPINTETLNRRLYKVLHQRFKDTSSLDSAGEKTPIEDEADVFKFTFTKDGEQYGTVFVTIDDNKTLKIYNGDDVADSPEAPTSGLGYDDTWFGLLRFLKSWAMQNQLGWDIENKDHLENDMARRDYMKKKEKISEGYYPMGRKASYSDSIPTVKMIIQHNRDIQEGEQRYRNVAKIFLENSQGERILAPTTKPGVAKVYARHIAEGGLPNDERWNHIKSMCEEYNKMAGFVRATRGHQFNESAQKLVESGIEHYNKLRETLSRMTGHRGYNMYFESWTPPLMEDDTDVSSITELFVQETVDPRIESVMPILSKLHKPVAEMKEVDALAEWADSLIEGEGGPEASEEEDGDTEGTAGEGGAEDAPEDNLSEAPGAETLAHNQSTEEKNLKAFGLAEEEKPGLWANIHAKRERIKHGSGERMRKPGSKGAPSAQDFKDAAKEGVEENLDANQKRVGQLGPTEKIGKKGAVGKLVGANESKVNKINSQGVTEGWKDVAATTALGAALLGGIAHTAGNHPSTKIQGKEFTQHSLPNDMSKVKTVTDDKGNKVYAWVEKSGMKPQYTYYWYAPIVKEQGVAEAGLKFHGGFPDVDHMPGAVYNHGNEPKPTSSKKMYHNKKEWTDLVDQINSSVYDDNSEFVSGQNVEEVRINDYAWAKWSNKKNMGYVDMGAMSEGQIKEAVNPGKINQAVRALTDMVSATKRVMTDPNAEVSPQYFSYVENAINWAIPVLHELYGEDATPMTTKLDDLLHTAGVFKKNPSVSLGEFPKMLYKALGDALISIKSKQNQNSFTEEVNEVVAEGQEDLDAIIRMIKK